MQTVKIRKGAAVYEYNHDDVTVKINGAKITEWVYDEFVYMFNSWKFKPCGSRQEMYVKDNEEGHTIFTNISCILDKEVSIVKSKEGWLRVRPTFNNKDMRTIRNYLKMLEEGK